MNNCSYIQYSMDGENCQMQRAGMETKKPPQKWRLEGARRQLSGEQRLQVPVRLLQEDVHVQDIVEGDGP